MVLAVQAEVVFAAEVQLQRAAARAAEGRWRAARAPRAAISSSPTPSIRELVPVKYASTKRRFRPDGLEELRTVVAPQRRDAHLGHGLEDALLDGA